MTGAPIRRSTRVTCIAAAACSGLAVLATLAPTPAVLRAPIVLLFCCWVPGVALFAALRAWGLVRSPAATIATSLSLIIVISQVALALHHWAPAPGTTVLAVASLAVLTHTALTTGPAGDPA